MSKKTKKKKQIKVSLSKETKKDLKSVLDYATQLDLALVRLFDNIKATTNQIEEVNNNVTLLSSKVDLAGHIIENRTK